MKNPRVFSTQFRERGAAALLVPSQVRDGISTSGSDFSGGKAPAGGDDGKKDAERLQTLLKTLKFTDEEISRVTELVATVAAVASVVGWVFAAISTIKQVLTFVGVLGSAKDPVMTALEAVGQKVQTIYAHLAKEAKHGLYLEAIGYRSKISKIRNDVGNLALSRSDTALTTAALHVQFLQEAIEKMLAPGNADIAFFRTAYGYTQKTFPANHWVDMATPFYLRQTDAIGSGVDYQDPSTDLATTIWDPGHYLDLVVPAIALRLAALEGTEPAFRSTGWDRRDLTAIHKGLQDFIAKWNSSFFMSTVVGPIDPQPHPSGGHFIHRNALTAFIGFSSPSIALCCVDPVSGMSLIEPEYSEGFAIREVSDPGGAASTYWVVDNYEQAIESAYARQRAMMSEVRARCGINRFYELMHSVYGLMVGSNGSEFVDLTDAKFSSARLEKMTTEQLGLGIIGAFAGKQGKTYPAQRYRQEVVKKFRFAMARRTDASRIQLGYRVKVSVGGGASGEANLVLCPFSKLNSPLQTVDFFPTGTRSATVTAPAALVYDVIQTAVFSAVEEDSFEKSGTIPNTSRFNRRRQQRRIFLNPRAGAVKFQVDVTFEFDINDDEHAFFGFANVEVRTGEEDTVAGGFLADVEVYETLPPFDATTGDPPREHLADSATLHFAAEFLDTTDDYFIDRDAGYAEMESRFRNISDRYAKSTEAGVIDPRRSVARQAQIEKSVAAFGEAELRAHPKQMRGLVAQLNVRSASSGKAHGPGC